ncbi:unnamed protein product, partial [Ectocarpus sp. 12 AP-2014]
DRFEGKLLSCEEELLSPQVTTRYRQRGKYINSHTNCCRWITLAKRTSFSLLRLSSSTPPLCKAESVDVTMMQSGAILAMMATCSSAFVLPQASFNRLPTAA